VQVVAVVVAPAPVVLVVVEVLRAVTVAQLAVRIHDLVAPAALLATTLLAIHL